MTTLLPRSLLAGLVFALSLSMAAPSGAADDGPKVVVNIYFSLKDSSVEARKKLLDSCKGYLAKQPGMVFFGAGTLAEDFKQAINDRDFDVSVHFVFKDKVAYDKYTETDDRKKFIEENRPNWKKVRVFSSLVD
jgi:Stress responsive A/B Barrel Domain